MKKFNIFLLSFLMVLPVTASAEATYDRAWETYVTAQKKLQNAMHYHLRLYGNEFNEYLDISQELQLALVDAKNERFYYFLNHEPARIVRDQGFEEFVNFAWVEEDEAMLVAENRDYEKLQKRIQRLQVELEEAPYRDRVRDNLFDFKQSAKYKEVLARFRFISDDIEAMLKHDQGEFDIY